MAERQRREKAFKKCKVDADMFAITTIIEANY